MDSDAVAMAVEPRSIKIFARREAFQSWAEVTVASNESVAASKKAVMVELGVDEAPDEVILLKDGSAAPLDDRLLVEGQLQSGDSVILKSSGAEKLSYSTHAACLPSLL